MKMRSLNSILVSVLILAVAAVLSCSTPPAGLPEAGLRDAYHKAVDDARTSEPDEISTDLIAITRYNKKLVWEGEPGQSRVLVVTWTSWDGYKSEVGQSVNNTRDVWVTAVPELREFYTKSRLSGNSLVLRLEQLLGLPPQSGKKWLVEIWANPDDLFRPSPDPEITDHEAELDFRKDVSAEYVQWFNRLKGESYEENGYPWTRLGYTYDWGNPSSEIGLSEFIIKAGAPVTIHSVSSISYYGR